MKNNKILICMLMLFTMIFMGVSSFATEVNNVAKIGETEYLTLIDAIEAVQDGETITLVSDAEGGFDVGNSTGTAPKKFILDMAGYTLDIKEPVGSTNTVTNGVRVLANSELTIKNGTINASSEKVKVVVANYGKLVLEDMKVNSGVNTLYTINNRGNLTLKGNTAVESSKAGGNVAITNDPYDYIYENTNAVLNIEDETVTVGNILVERYGNSKNSGVPEINISAGTIEKIQDDGNTAIEFVGNITGGNYSTPVDVKFLNENNLVEVKNASEDTETYSYYATIANAMKDAGDSAVIKDLSLTEKQTKYTVVLDYGYDDIKKELIVAENTKITLPELTREKYTFKGWEDVLETYEGNTEYTVTSDISLMATWKAVSTGGSSTPGETDKPDEPVEEAWKNPFEDLKEEDWFYDAVKFAHENSLFKGVTEKKFGAEIAMTRGMMVTVLYRLAEAEEKDTATFDDVDKDMYYSNAIAWAAKLEIVNGVGDNKFEPDREITREEMATMMARYIKKMDLDVKDSEEEYVAYEDEKEISSFATEAVKDMKKLGLMEGKDDNKFDPKGNAKRCEVATLLMRFVKMLEEK
ncbi:MAG: S-layer homology domain-containing protein [Clostridia bacterium]|nr:S-layer homology domain-containing protein [Clostridia bacterium]